MSNEIKTIVLKVNTGFVGAVHEEEIEYTGQTEKEIETELDNLRDQVCAELEATYEFQDEDGYEIEA